MGFYSQTIFPAVCDLLLGQSFLHAYRRELLATVSGDILEIGFGTGLNLPHYPAHVRKITTIEPNAGMNRHASKRIIATGIEVDQRVLECEQLPFANDSFDCIVSSWTLCSIGNVGQALNESYRVLKPGGRFLFLEHGLSHEPSVQRWQRRLNWLEMQIGGGCHLDRNIKEVIAAQAFVTIQSHEFYLPKTPKTHGFMYRGIATK